MRLSELLASVVVDSSGRRLGRVRDLWLSRDGLRPLGLVLGDGILADAAHAWGFAAGRAQGPWLLRKLTEPAVRQALFVAADQVVDWGPGTVRIDVDGSDLPRLVEVQSG